MKYPKLLLKNDADTIVLDPKRLVDISEIDEADAMETRFAGSLEGKAYWLSDTYNYVMGRDESDMLVLVPLKK